VEVQFLTTCRLRSSCTHAQPVSQPAPSVKLSEKLSGVVLKVMLTLFWGLTRPDGRNPKFTLKMRCYFGVPGSVGIKARDAKQTLTSVCATTTKTAVRTMNWRRGLNKGRSACLFGRQPKKLITQTMMTTISVYSHLAAAPYRARRLE